MLAPTNLASAARSSIAAADFDGDGKTDLSLGVVTGQPNVGLVLRRTGSALIPTLADYHACFQTVQNGFSADGDGDIDLIGSYVVRNPRFHGPSAGSRRQSFEGTLGEAGARPVLGASGPFRGGETEVLPLTGVPGPTLAILGISLLSAELPNVPLPGLTLRLDPTMLITGGWPITENGQGRAAAATQLPILLPHGLQGITFYVQAFVVDPAAAVGIGSTNVLIKQVGN
ncbi:MAG: hypothetical protein ABIP94_21505 [Planctomycetota bacterium]